MKHEIIRSQPVVPKVEKIVLELTPGELIYIARAIGHSSWAGSSEPNSCWGRIKSPVIGEASPTENTAAAHQCEYGIYDSITDALVSAGLARRL